MLAYWAHEVDDRSMKYMILVLVFALTPYILLSMFVMPALESLQETYSNAGTIAEQVASE